jgi:signal transduction histidine kinase
METSSTTRVLLVEDQPADALLVRRILRSPSDARQRFVVQHAATLTEGLEALDRDPADVLLLDLALPDSHGPATVVRLRERNGRVPVVVLTGSDDAEVSARAIDAGADEYLAKDGLHGRLLRQTIRHAIERRRTRATEPHDVRRALLHDLKNLQTCILGNARLIQAELEEAGLPRRRIDALLGAARVARRVIERLSDECEDAAEHAPRLDLSEFVRSIEPLLRAALPEHVQLRLELAEGLLPVAAAAEALRRTLLELVVNAAEAIGDRRGRVEVRTGLARLEVSELSELVAPVGIGTGPHSWVEVRDDGIGFDRQTHLRLFEGGFSSKGSGRGHGLAQVKQTLAEHAAGLRVASRPELGSVFRIYLPSRA